MKTFFFNRNKCIPKQSMDIVTVINIPLNNYHKTEKEKFFFILKYFVTYKDITHTSQL